MIDTENLTPRYVVAAFGPGIKNKDVDTFGPFDTLAEADAAREAYGEDARVLLLYPHQP